MTMLRSTSRRRELLVEALRELANLTAGALVLGRFVTPDTWPVWPVVTGAAAWFVLIGIAFFIAEGNNDD